MEITGYTEVDRGFGGFEEFGEFGVVGFCFRHSMALRLRLARYWDFV